MPLISKIFFCLAGFFHILFFIFESFLFMNAKVYRIFGATSEAQAQVMQNFAYNQGFYNLFLAIGIIAGTLLTNRFKENVGDGIALFCAFSMIGAGLVLFFSTGKVLGTFIQAGIPLIAIIAYFFQSKKHSD